MNPTPGPLLRVPGCGDFFFIPVLSFAVRRGLFNLIFSSQTSVENPLEQNSNLIRLFFGGGCLVRQFYFKNRVSAVRVGQIVRTIGCWGLASAVHGGGDFCVNAKFEGDDLEKDTLTLSLSRKQAGEGTGMRRFCLGENFFLVLPDI